MALTRSTCPRDGTRTIPGLFPELESSIRVLEKGSFGGTSRESSQASARARRSPGGFSRGNTRSRYRGQMCRGDWKHEIRDTTTSVAKTKRKSILRWTRRGAPQIAHRYRFAFRSLLVPTSTFQVPDSVTKRSNATRQTRRASPPERSPSSPLESPDDQSPPRSRTPHVESSIYTVGPRCVRARNQVPA